MASMDTTSAQTTEFRAKVGRVPAAVAFEPVERIVHPFKPTVFMRRLMVASGCAVLFFSAALLSFKGGQGLLDHVAVSEAQASSAPSAPTVSKAPGAVVIQEDSGTIVGQLTKITPEAEQVTEIKTASTSGKSTSEDLLTIVGKY